MTLQTIKYIVSILAFIQVGVVLAAAIVIVRNVILGLRTNDKSKYRRAARVLGYALGGVILIGIIQLFVLLK